MKHLLYITVFLLLSGTKGLAQDTITVQKCPDYDVRFKKLKELHMAHFFSESSIRSRKLEREFLKKLNSNNVKFDRVSDDVLHYIIENVDKTSFGSYEAAEMEYATLKEARKAAGMASRESTDKDPSSYRLYLAECVLACGTKIVADVLKEVQPKMMEDLLKE